MKEVLKARFWFLLQTPPMAHLLPSVGRNKARWHRTSLKWAGAVPKPKSSAYFYGSYIRKHAETTLVLNLPCLNSTAIQTVPPALILKAAHYWGGPLVLSHHQTASGISACTIFFTLLGKLPEVLLSNGNWGLEAGLPLCKMPPRFGFQKVVLEPAF